MTVESPEAPTEAPAEQKVYTNYWGVDEKHKWFFPDGEQYIEFKVMNEGARTQFQQMTNQNLTIRQNNEATVRMDPAKERHTLITTSVFDWKMFIGSDPAAFSKSLLEKWLTVADPKMVDDLEFAIRKANPWMQADMTLAEVDKELDRLRGLRQDIVDREAGEASSTDK